jgi:DNA-binding CsgD family transcriptional regulator
MIGVPLKEQIGRRLHQVFAVGAHELELALRRVWATGHSLSNLELTPQLPDRAAPTCWVVNFYPITDEWRQVRMVAITFCEVTKGRCVELKLSHLKNKFQSHVLRQPSVLGEEFSEISARTFELVNRSVALLKNSLHLRFYTSARQLELSLVRHALYMTPNPRHEAALSPSRPPSDSYADTLSSPEAPIEVDPLVSCPSPRERQVLRFLADGKSNKEIGSILDISTRTVECYRARIMLKLDLHSTAALVRYAVRNKIVEA